VSIGVLTAFCVCPEASLLRYDAFGKGCRSEFEDVRGVEEKHTSENRLEVKPRKLAGVNLFELAFSATRYHLTKFFRLRDSANVKAKKR
jgi:hypothetical protein